MKLYTESAADQTDHFDDVFVRENVAHGYDVSSNGRHSGYAEFLA